MFGIVVTTVTVTLLFVYWYKRPNRYPDGPRGLPFIGIIPWIGGRNLGEVFMEYQKGYGSIFSVRIGREDWVVLNKFEDMHEALVRQGSVFSGRSCSQLLKVLTKGKGLLFVDYGHFWSVQRKFGLATLRSFGVRKRSMEDKIRLEISHLKNEILKKKSKPFDPQSLLKIAVSNVLCNILLGNRFDYDDIRFKKILKILSGSNSSHQSTYLLVIRFAFWARHLPYFREAYSIFLKDVELIKELFHEAIEQHKGTYDGNNVNDFIDAFLREMEAETDSSFQFEQLSQYILDLFMAGAEGTSITLRWCFLCLMHFPEHQENIYLEITHVIASSTPSMKHLPDMPYTAAFIHEITRHRTLAPIPMAHKTNERVEFMGYNIPKNTIIIPNLWAVHYDPQLFTNPDEFNPQRFIDHEGKFVKSPHVIPFGIGPRQCLAMQLAITEVFILLTTLIQQFEILPPTDGKIPSFHDGNFGFNYAAKPFEAIFKPRN